MSLTPCRLVKLAQELTGKDEAAVDRVLQEQQFSPEERISVKHAISAAAVQWEIAAQELATDAAECDYRPQPSNEIQRLLVKVGFELGRRYGAADVDRLLREAGVDDISQRIACKLELAELHMTASAHDQLRRPSGKSLQARADTQPARQVLLNPDGTPRVLRFA